jgi:hypothetical protein
MSLATTAMLLALQGQRPSIVIDTLTASPGGGQNAIPLRGGAHRFVFVNLVVFSALGINSFLQIDCLLGELSRRYSKISHLIIFLCRAIAGR